MTGRKTAKENKLYRAVWTEIWIPAHREVDLELSVKRKAKRTKALVSLYWSSRSLLPKDPPNQISHKSTKVDPIRSSQTWKNSYQISNSILFSISKHYFSKIQSQLMIITGFISRMVTPKDKSKSNPLARLKVRIFSKSVVSFQSFPVSLRGRSLPSRRATNIKEWK